MEKDKNGENNNRKVRIKLLKRERERERERGGSNLQLLHILLIRFFKFTPRAVLVYLLFYRNLK